MTQHTSENTKIKYETNSTIMSLANKKVLRELVLYLAKLKMSLKCYLIVESISNSISLDATDFQANADTNFEV